MEEDESMRKKKILLVLLSAFWREYWMLVWPFRSSWLRTAKFPEILTWLIFWQPCIVDFSVLEALPCRWRTNNFTADA